MDVRTFMRCHDKDAVRQVAAVAETSVAYLEQLAGGHRRPSPELARRLHAASGGAMRLADLRPDLWGEETAA